jgi:hypothetical protein
VQLHPGRAVPAVRSHRPYERDVPHDGAVGLPWEIDGEPLELGFEPHTSGPLDGWTFRSATEPLAPDSVVELWDGLHAELLGSWTVGSRPDVESPRWDGSYTVDSTNIDGDVCGEFDFRHEILFEGATDDFVGGHLVAVAVGLDPSDHELGDETGFSVRYDACSYDPSLVDRWHRGYEVTLIDAAGNTSGPFEVRTGRNVCGCGGPPNEYAPSDEYLDYDKSSCATSASGGWTALTVALVVLRRRR